MVIIKQPYPNTGYLGDGILYGYSDAKRRKKDENKVFLCIPDDNIDLKPEDYKFYKVVDDKPIQVAQTSRFYRGKRFINYNFYCGDK